MHIIAIRIKATNNVFITNFICVIFGTFSFPYFFILLISENIRKIVNIRKIYDEIVPVAITINKDKICKITIKISSALNDFDTNIPP